jgi:hypothetical protein
MGIRCVDLACASGYDIESPSREWLRRMMNPNPYDPPNMPVESPIMPFTVHEQFL